MPYVEDKLYVEDSKLPRRNKQEVLTYADAVKNGVNNEKQLNSVSKLGIKNYKLNVKDFNKRMSVGSKI